MDWLDELVCRQLRPTGGQWREIVDLAHSLGIPCNGRGCCNYQLDIATQVAIILRKERMGQKRQPEYRLAKRWETRGFQLVGSREVINKETFTQKHAERIVKLGLAWKYLEVVESWNRADTKEELTKIRKQSEDADVVEISENAPVEGDGVDAPVEVKKTRRRKKKAAETAEASSTETTEASSTEEAKAE